MSFAKTAGLTVVFMIAVDLVVAAGTGLTGVHALMVDGGAALGESLGIPHFDWGGMVDHGEFGFLDSGTGLHLGHAH